MGLRDRLDRALGLGPSDEPRAVAVAGPRAGRARPVVSTPGARVRVQRDGRDGDLGRVLLWLQRRAVPVELADGPNGLWLDGVPITPTELRRRL
jgi:hypothetical protein